MSMWGREMREKGKGHFRGVNGFQRKIYNIKGGVYLGIDEGGFEDIVVFVKCVCVCGASWL